MGRRERIRRPEEVPVSMPMVNQVVLEIRRQPRIFEWARAKNAVFARYANAEAALTALLPSSDLDAEARSALVSELLGEAQRSQRSLWTSLLLGTFARMLTRIRVRTRPRAGEEKEDVDQRVLAAFFDAIQHVRPGPFAANRVRWETQRRAWHGARPDEELPIEDLGEELTVEDLLTESPLRAEQAMVDGVAARDIARALEADGQRELIDVLVCSGDENDTLRDHVDAVNATLPARERDAEYRRLLRLRERATPTLARRFGPRAA